MPNYRLTHKMTGTTVPATAGYYGLHNQSTTKWKMAGSEMYQWKSDDFANAYFMGATIDSDAFKTVTISGANDHLTQDVQNSYVLLNGVRLNYAGINDLRPIYGNWPDYYPYIIYDGSGGEHWWGITDGPAFYYGGPYLDSYLPPAGLWETNTVEFFPSNNAPAASAFNGAYVYSSTVSKWLKSTTHSIWKTTVWNMTDGVITYTAPNNGLNTPPATGWVYQIGGVDAATASLSISSSANFAATSLSGTWQAVNGGSGTPVYSEYSIGEAWETAEKAVFDSLKTWLGGTEGKDCFRGYLPFQNVDKKFADVWMLTSGGTAGAFDIERTYGMSGAWCNVMQNADIDAIFENRITALHFCGAVLAWIKSTSNFNKTANVNWFRLRNLPAAPKEIIEGNRRFWEVKIPLEMLYLTEGVYV